MTRRLANEQRLLDCCCPGRGNLATHITQAVDLFISIVLVHCAISTFLLVESIVAASIAYCVVELSGAQRAASQC